MKGIRLKQKKATSMP